MELPWEKLENYQKNLRCIQEEADELLSHMKGHDWSFRRSITDGKRRLSREKLQALVTEMLDIWAAKVRNDTDADPATGESLAEPWLRERRELYGFYLYLVMRCSLERGAYSAARGGLELKERTDFAFLLEQAMRLSREWCVIAGPDGTRRNELYCGYDGHFGFHLYYALHDPGVLNGYICPGNDYSLTPDWKRVCDQPSHLLTNEGNQKRICLRHFGGRFRKEEDAGWYFPFSSEEAYYEFQTAEMDQRSEEGSRAMELTFLATNFEAREEYCSACERFAELFQNARPEVLRDFYQDLEEIVDLYLAVKEIPPLTDTDKTLDVYGCVFDGPLRRAKRYGRGIQWDNL